MRLVLALIFILQLTQENNNEKEREKQKEKEIEEKMQQKFTRELAEFVNAYGGITEIDKLTLMQQMHKTPIELLGKCDKKEDNNNTRRREKNL